jgi:hypothetical protein
LKQQPKEKLVLHLTVDGFLAVVVPVYMQLAHPNTTVLVVLWAALIYAMASFVWVVPAKTGALVRVLIILAGAALVGYSAYDSIRDKRIEEEVREETEGARIDIENVQFADVGKSDASFPFFNIYYKNNGHLTSQGSRRRVAFSSTPRLYSEAEIDDYFKRTEDDPYMFDKNDQIPAGNEAHFSEPNAYGEEQRAVESVLPSVKAGNSVLYIFVVWKYRDRLMPPGKIRVSEFCAFYIKPLADAHFCRQNSTHTEDVSVKTD